MALVDTLSTTGVRTFGASMPVVAPSWTAGTPTVAADGLSLTLSSGTWLAPCHGFTRTPAQVAERSGVFLRDGAGAAVATGASVISLLPQQLLRLARLYALLLEDATGARPGRAAGQPARPVPAHVVVSDGGVTTGGIDPGDTLAGGRLSFHDALGQPIDALAVASAFLAFMTAHEPLQARGASDPFDATPPLSAMLASLAPSASVRVRLVDGAGQPVTSAGNLTGLTAVSGAPGVFTVGGLTSSVAKATTSTSFPDDVRQSLLLGLATTGRLGDSVGFPALPSGRTLQRDFFTLRVLDLRSYLLGTPAAAWDGTKIEPRPAVRRDEAVTLLPDGNDVLGAAAAALSGAPTESLAVAQRIDGAFATPTAAGAPAHWPAFPPLGGVAPAPAGSVPVSLAESVVATAAFLTSPSTPPSPDVVLSLTGLPAGAAVRAYSRRFSAEAVETRGDGGGAVVDGTGGATILLRDPLGLVVYGRPQPPLPADPVLHVDLVVVKRSGESRILGDVSCPISATTVAAPPTGTNPFGTAARRGICHAGILASGEPRTAPSPTAGGPPAALSLLSEGTPRDAPRLPGMARRELIVAGRTGATWSAVVSSGRLTPEAHHASPRLGAPGGLGGRETQTVGAATSGGRLAFDLARAAFRRTTTIVSRLDALATATWDEPAAATGGPFAGAVLQTVAAQCESPELSLLRTASIIDPDSPNLPRTFDELVATAKQWLQQLVAGAGVPASLTSRATTLIDKLDDLRDNAPADESRKERIFTEILREIAASGWGRRDTQWALAGALGRAERFVYIETPGVSPTAAPATTDAYARDLFEVLTARMNANPALHVVVCTPDEPDYPFGFNPFSDDERKRRRDAVLALPTANVPDPVGNRVVAFHPVGFPGRPSRLESTTVIVDDVWALVGSSTLRRRGLTFDGSTDLVVTGQDLVEGRSPAIAALRRSLQAARLGIPAPVPVAAGSVPPLPTSSFVRLSDGVEAFHEIREMLRGGGQGRITRLAPADPVGRPPTTPAPDVDVVDPDSETYDLVQTLITLAFASGAAL
jgi:hypothetical protein